MTTRATRSEGLYAKLQRFRSEFGPVEKTGTNKSQGYGFAEAVVIGRRALELMGELGLTMHPEDADLVHVDVTPSGKQQVLTLRFRWRITDVESGDSIVVTSFGQGSDATDKAAPKAQTNAMKYALLLLLQTAADDPERDEDEEERPRRSTRTRRSTSRGTRRNVEQEDEDGDDPLDQDSSEPQDGSSRSSSRAMASDTLKKKVRARQHEVGLSDDQLKALAEFYTGKETSKDWTERDAEKILGKLDNEKVVATFLGEDDDEEDED